MIRVLPRNSEYGWGSHLWLAFACFFFVHPMQDHAGLGEWLTTVFAFVLFIFLYLGFFWLKNWGRWVVSAMIAALGAFFLPMNPGASVFFVYAASLIGLTAEPIVAIPVLALLLGLFGVEMWRLHFPMDTALGFVAIAAIVAVGNIFFKQRTQSLARLRMAQEEIERLAKVAERERIARDLHDILGHTLSLIVLKSELASRLIESDPASAANEIRDVEMVSRGALAEVRSAIGGYRTAGLDAELARAKDVLATAGIETTCDWSAVALSSERENVLALALREAVINVIRHSHAHHCHLKLGMANGNCRLEVQDDGSGGDVREGHGLLGMRERVESLGGNVLRDSNAGTALTISVPSGPKNGVHAK